MSEAWQVELNKYNYDELQAAADRRQMYSVHRHLAPVNATHEELKAFIIDTGNMGISHQADIAWKSQVDVWKSTLFKLDIGHRNFLYQLREAAFTVRTGRSVLSGSKITFLVADGRRDFNLDQLNESFEDAHRIRAHDLSQERADKHAARRRALTGIVVRGRARESLLLEHGISAAPCCFLLLFR